MKTENQFASNVPVAPRLRLRIVQFVLMIVPVVLAIAPASAAVIEAWVQRYNGPWDSRDVPQAVAVDTVNNVIVTGVSMAVPDYSFYTAKYAAADGALLWEKRGPAGEALAVDGGGNVIVAGSSWNGTNSDYYTGKYEATTGAMVWEQRYNGPQNETDLTRAVAVDRSGNVLVTGSSYSNPTNSDYYTIKYAASNGLVLWAKRFDGLGNAEDSAAAIVADPAGNVVVTGHSGRSADRGYTVKYAGGDGALLWERRSPAGFRVGVDRDGNVAVTDFFWNGTDRDIYTAKYASADGSVLWERRYGTPNSTDDPRAIAIDVEGNVVVTGSSYGIDPSYYTVKYAASDGATIWEQRGPVGSAEAVVIHEDGAVVVTGSSYTTSGTADYYTAKYTASDGRVLWEKRYNGPGNQNDVVPTSRCLAIGRDGMVAITGHSDGSSRQSPWAYDYATVVYWENPPPGLEIAPGGVYIRLTGVVGRSYEVHRATSITGPWSIIGTVTAPSGGIIDYVDTNRPAASAFYRVLHP